MATQGGPAQPVSVQTGGIVQGGAAIPVAVVSDGRATLGGPAQPVVVVTSGPVQGGPALPVVAATGAQAARVMGGPALKVYVVSGSLGGSTPTQTYTQKVQALAPIAYWPFADASGATATDESGNGRNGAYNNVTLGATGIGDGRTAATFDGTSAYVNLYTASLNGAFNGQKGSLHLWIQVAAAAVWSDTVFRTAILILVNGTNFIEIIKSNVVNTLVFEYKAGGVDKQASTILGATTWIPLGMTWDKAADELKFYANGAQVGATLNGLGAWAGALSPVLTSAGGEGASVFWKGNLAHVALFSTILSGPQMASLATVP